MREPIIPFLPRGFDFAASRRRRGEEEQSDRAERLTDAAAAGSRSRQDAEREKRKAAMSNRRAPRRSQPEPVPQSKPKGKKRDNLPGHLKTASIKMTHLWALDGRAQDVQVRKDAPILRLRRLKCEEGDHVTLFLRDWEMVGASLRSVGFDVGGGGGGNRQAFPVARIDAARRLHDLRLFLGPEDYDLVEAYLCRGVTIEQIHGAGGEQHMALSAMLRKAIDRMAAFYTPRQMRQSRTHRAVLSLIAQFETAAERQR